MFAVVQRIFNAKTLEEAKALWPEMVDRATARGGEGASAAVAAYLLELLKRRLGGPEDVEAELGAELLGAAEAREAARAEQAAMLLRFAERKFGREARDRLAGAATAEAGREGLARLGDWIVDCDTLDELMAQVENGAAGDQT